MKTKTIMAYVFSIKFYIIVVIVAGLFFGISSTASASTFTVNSVANSGAGTLSQAITDANTNSGADEITFNIPGSGPHEIIATGYLPEITGETFINGASQPGTVCGTDNIQPQIILKDFKSYLGFNSNTSNSSVRGIAVPESTINVQADNFTLTCSFVGTQNGTTGVNTATVNIDPNVTGIIIGGNNDTDRNIFAGENNIASALYVHNGSAVTVNNNYFGVQKNGVDRLGEYVFHIRTETGSSVTIMDSVFGDSLSTVSPYGSLIFAGGDVTLKGNYFGTDKTRTANLAGISPIINGNGNYLFGGTSPADKNYIYNQTRQNASSGAVSYLGNIFSNNGAIISSSQTPVISDVVESGGNTTFRVKMDSNFVDGATFRVELFSNPSAVNSKGEQDATELIHAENITKNVAGDQEVDITVPGTGYTYPTLTASEVDATNYTGYKDTSNIGQAQIPVDLQVETDDRVEVIETGTTDHKIEQTFTNLGPHTVSKINFRLDDSNCYAISSITTSGTATNTGSYSSEAWIGELEQGQNLTLTFTGSTTACNGASHVGFDHVISSMTSSDEIVLADTDQANNNYSHVTAIRDHITDLQIDTTDGVTQVSTEAVNHEITQTITNLGQGSVTHLDFSGLDTHCFTLNSTNLSGTATDSGTYDNLDWDGTLEQNQTLTLTFIVNISCAGGDTLFFNHGSIDGIYSGVDLYYETRTDNNDYEDYDTVAVAPVQPVTDLAVTNILNNPEDVAIGGVLNYTLTLTNNGPEGISLDSYGGASQNPFQDSLFLDFVPFELNFVVGSSSNSSISCSLFSVDTNDPNAASILSSHPDHDIVRCAWIGDLQTLSAGQSVSTNISVIVDASSDLNFATHTITGWAQNDPDFPTILDPFNGGTNQCGGYADMLDCYAGTGINNYAANGPMADLKLNQILVNSGDISAGETVNYDVTITNKGPNALDLATLDGSSGTNALLGNVYPASDLTFVDDDNANVDCTDFGPGSNSYIGAGGQDHPNHQLISCYYMGSSQMLNPGASLTIRLSFTANAGVSNKFINYAVMNGVASDPEAAQINNLFGTATGDILDIISNENFTKTTYVGSSAITDLSINKVLVNTGKISAGDTVDYDVTIANNGPADLDLETLNGSQNTNVLLSDLYPGADLAFVDDNNPSVNCYDVGLGSIVFLGSAGQDHPDHQILSCTYTGISQVLQSGDSLTIRLSFIADAGVGTDFTNYVLQAGVATDPDTAIIAVQLTNATQDILDTLSSNNMSKASYSYALVDSDNDGISDGTEDAGPNGGDANKDGTLDSLQNNVTSFVNSTTNKRAVLAVSDGCSVTTATVVAESTNAEQDPSYDYPVGLMDFELECGTPGYTADITQFYFDASDRDYVVRKYDTNNDDYSDIDSAVVSKETISSEQVVKASYQITDGSKLDMDNTTDGNIKDPTGLAIVDSTETQNTDNESMARRVLGSLARTGQSIALNMIFAVCLIGGGIILIRKNVTK